MIKNKVQSTMSTGTNQTMTTMFRNEMAANRIETQKQINLIQTELTSFQTLVTGLMPHLTQSLAISPTSADTSCPSRNTNNDQQQPTYDNVDSDDNYQAYGTPTTHLQETHNQSPITQTDPKSLPPIKKVSMADQKMSDTISHSAPSASGDTPPPKRQSAGHPPNHLPPPLATKRGNQPASSAVSGGRTAFGLYVCLTS
jgi:hypothetical protein